MLTSTLRGMLAHKMRLVLTTLSIALGVAFLAGTLILTDTIKLAFDEMFNKTTATTDVAVRSEASFIDGSSVDERKPLPASMLDTVREVDGVAAAEGSVTGYALLIAPNGKPIQPKSAPTLGFNMPEDAKIASNLDIRSGHAPRAPNEVAIDAASAKANGIKVGTPIKIGFRDSAQTFQVVGTVGFGSNDDLAGSTSAVFATATAQQVFGKAGMFDDIAVRADKGVSDSALIQRISEVLPTGVEAVTGQTVADEQSSAVAADLSFFNIALMVFAGIALFVGSFIIWNTFSMQVAQRTRELALFRAIGASRRQVFGALLTEALLLGSIASALGLALGIAVAKGLSALTSTIGIELPTTTMQILPRTIIVSLLVGVVVTVVASLAPARKATRVAPVEALRDSAPSTFRFSPARLVSGLVLTLAGIATLLAGLFAGAGMVFIGLGVVAAVLGVTALMPLIVRPISAVIGAPLRTRGVPGELAQQNAMRNPKRTSSTAAALMIGLTMVAGVSVFASSLKASFHEVLGGSTHADLYVKSASVTADGISPEVAKAVRTVDGVDLVTEMGWGKAKFDGKMTSYSSIDPSTAGRTLEFDLSSGRIEGMGPDGVLVSKKVAEAHGWQVGDAIPAEFGQTGATSLTLAGVFDRKGFIADDYVLSIAGQDARDSQRLDTNVLLTVDKGADVATVQAAVEQQLEAFPGATVLDQAGYEKVAGGFIDKLLGFVTVLLLLAVVIALLGIINTLALSVFERTRELGLLRAVGMTQAQVRAMVRWESVIISAIGAVMGAALGIGLGVALSTALADKGITEIAIPGPQLALYVLLAAVAGVLAAIGPARRAAKVDVLKAVVTD